MKFSHSWLVGALLLSAPFIPAAEPLAQAYKEVFHNPNPEYYVEGCGLVHLADGAFVAVVPVVPRVEWSEARRVENSVINIVRSTDGGATWQPVSKLPYYSAVPWLHEGNLYLFANKPGTKYRNDDVLLLRSLDGGKTWSEPVTLFQGHYWNCNTGMAIHQGRLYWAVDDLTFGPKRGPCVIAGDLSKDVMDPHSWRISKAVPLAGIPPQLTNPKFAEFPDQYLEPNVIVVQGKVRVLATVKPKRQSTASVAAVLDVTDDGKDLGLQFTQFFGMPGGQLKFCTVWDEKSKMYWATANLVVDSQGVFDWWDAGKQRGNFWGFAGGGNDRRFLMLQYSLDGMNWFQAGCIAQAAKISQSFMYAVPVIDGDDLAIIARSSVHAPNQHDADNATFHRVKQFRKLALDLVPKPEGE